MAEADAVIPSLSGADGINAREVRSQSSSRVFAGMRSARVATAAPHFRALIEVAIESLAMKVAPHQLEARPPGFVGVTLPAENAAVWSLVNTLHCALVRLVS